MLELDLSDTPQEVVDYGFDQFPDRADRALLEEAIESVMAHEQFERDYNNQEFRVHDGILSTVLRDALYEKVSDIDREVRHGERDDYSPDETGSSMRSPVRSAFMDATLTVDLSDLPEEVTDYGFDQFIDLLTLERVEEEISKLRSHDQIDLEYDERAARFNDTVLTSILRGALYEKVDDIAAEVRRGERNDYKDEDIERMRRDVREAFEAANGAEMTAA